MSNPGSRPRSYLYGQAFLEAETRYVELRRTMSPTQAKDRLGLTDSAQRKFESAYTSQRFADIPDSSCPAFARHDQHIAAAMEAGGFQTIVWRKRA